MEGEKRGKIDELEEKLYSKTGPQVIDEGRTQMKRPDYAYPPDWGNMVIDENMVRTERTNSKLKVALIFSLAFLIFSGAVASYLFFTSSSVMSVDNVDILREGPAEVPSGESTTWNVSIKNRNSASIEGVVLTVVYPEGTKKTGNSNEDIVREKITYDTLNAGEEKKYQISAILNGEKGSEQNIKMSIDFRITGSSAIFHKEKNYDVVISSAPLVIDIDYPSEINIGEEIVISLNLLSNSDITLKDILLTAKFPFGFQLISAEPKQFFGNNIWKIKELKPGDKATVVMTGKIIGSEGEDRDIRFSAGTASPTDPKKIQSELASQQASISLKRAFISLSTNINGNVGNEVVVSSIKGIELNVGWENMLEDKIVDAQIQISANGEIINLESFKYGNAIFRPAERLITWDKTNTSALSEVVSEESGSVRTTFSILPFAKILNSLPPEIILDIRMSGKQVGQNNIQKLVVSNIQRKIKISSDLEINSKVVHSIGPFTNSGPMPPKADAETTYTIILGITNSFNNLKGVKVSANIPSYVKWLGSVNPAGENVAFNPVTNNIVWSPGEIKRGLGYGNQAREMAFQIALKPSISQIGDSPKIVTDIKIIGDDQFTGEILLNKSGELNTFLPSDPKFNINAYRVIK